MRNVRKMLTAGVTGFFDVDSIFDLGIDIKRAIQHGVIEGPRVAAGSYALMTSVGGAAVRPDARPGHHGLRAPGQRQDEIVAEVRRLGRQGADWIKVHVTGSLGHRRSEGELITFTKDELRLITDIALATPGRAGGRALPQC